MWTHNLTFAKHTVTAISIWGNISTWSTLPVQLFHVIQASNERTWYNKIYTHLNGIKCKYLPSGCMKQFFCTYQRCDTVSVYHHQLPESIKRNNGILFLQFSRQNCHISITGHTTASTPGIIKESSYDENETVSISSYCLWRTMDSQTHYAELWKYNKTSLQFHHTPLLSSSNYVI
jgi:hypothetical protein